MQPKEKQNVTKPSATRPNAITFRLPRTPDEQILKILAQKYRTLRMKGLELSPEAFSSTLAAESKYPEGFWISRLTNPQLETFICAIVPARSSMQDEYDVTDDQLEWVAQATLRGPISISDFTLPIESGQRAIDPALEHYEQRWQFLALYTLPSVRGCGLARSLCQEALRWLEAKELLEQNTIQAIQVRTMIKPNNTASLTLFRKLGFLDVGLCTLAEAMVANGETIPREWDGEDPRRHNRHGCILSLRLVKRQ